jgi:hypothetical protein
MAGTSDYVVFLFTSPSNRSFGFKTYTNELGQAVGFVNGYDKDKMPIYHRWRWDQDGSRLLPVHKNKTDQNKLNAVEFLRNSPNCLGSPRGTYSHTGEQMDVYFREVNEEKSAEIALDTEIKRMEAQNISLSVKGQEFVDLCALIGVINKEESIMRFALYDFAKNKPEKFMELYSDPVRQLKSLLRRGVELGVITKEGKMYSWEKHFIGVDEDDAVLKLSKDEKLHKSIKANVDKVA